MQNHHTHVFKFLLTEYFFGTKILFFIKFPHKLENGMSRERVKAAKELADVYALLLARDDGCANEDILQRAVLLFDRIPEAGTIDLRLQLYRATFIAAEQILERYRIRVSDVEEAEQAVMHLREVATKLETLQDSLQKK